MEARATANGIDMKKEIGFGKDDSDEYKSTYAIHMDALCWVKRDSYLPQGSQGLKVSGYGVLRGRCEEWVGLNGFGALF